MKNAPRHDESGILTYGAKAIFFAVPGLIIAVVMALILNAGAVVKTTHYCDQCEKEIQQPFNWVTVFVTKECTLPRDIINRVKTIELCNECYNKIDFLKSTIFNIYKIEIMPLNDDAARLGIVSALSEYKYKKGEPIRSGWTRAITDKYYLTPKVCK